MLHDTRFHQGLSQDNFSDGVEYKANVVGICGTGDMCEDLLVRIAVQASELL